MAARTPGEFRETASRAVGARQEAQGARIGGYVDDALGDRGAAFGTEQALRQNRSSAAQALYDQSYAAAPPSGEFYTDMLGRRSVQDALRAAERTADELQVPVSDLFVEMPNPAATPRRVPTYTIGADGKAGYRDVVDNPTVRIPTMRGWDFVKRELDAKVNQLFRSGDTTEAAAVKETRNALRDQLGRDNPAYGRALATYSDESASVDAVGAGRELIRSRDDDAARASYGAMSPADRPFARLGASREIGVTVGRAPSGQDKTRIFDTPTMRGRLDTLLEDPVVRSVFEGRIGRERAMMRTNREVTGGSNTAENLGDGADNAASLLGAAGAAASGNVASMARQLLGAVQRYGSGMNEDVAERVGAFLMSADPAEIRKLNSAFQAATSDTSRGRLAGGIIAGVSALPKSPDEEMMDAILNGGGLAAAGAYWR